MENVEKIDNEFQNTEDKKLLGKIEKSQIVVAIVSLILGTLLHFTYQWSNESGFIAIFSAVNESVWEHLKLVFFPMLITGIIEYFFLKGNVNNYLEAKTIGIFTAIAFIVVFFFTYTGIIGTNFIVIDILTFIVSILLGEWVSYKLMTREEESTTTTIVLSIIILAILFFNFIICTFIPPKANLFRDPTNGLYGVEKYE